MTLPVARAAIFPAPGKPSPLLLARQPTLTVEYTLRLRERHYGCFQADAPDQARSQHPQDFACCAAVWRIGGRRTAANRLSIINTG